MLSLRAAFVVGIAALLGTRLTTCRSPGEGGTEPSPGKSEAAAVDVNLKGVDTSELTSREKAEWSRYVSDFLATSEGLALTKAFMRIKEAKLRRRIVDLVEEIAGDKD